MNILPIVKGATGLVASLGAGAVVGNAIKATTPSDMKKITKVLVGVGGIVISSIAGDMAAKYIEDQIQAGADNWRAGKDMGERWANARFGPDNTPLFDTTAGDNLPEEGETKAN